LKASLARPGHRLRPTHRDNRAVDLERFAWLTTVAACVIGAVLLLVAGYSGYAAVALAVGLSAGINLL